MEGGPRRDPRSVLRGDLPPEFDARAVAIAAGRTRTYDETEWKDALVLVDEGEIELLCVGGITHRFRRGDVLWLAGLALRGLHNRGTEPALLVAVSRRRPAPRGEHAAGSDEFRGGRVST
jgi:hypothetical protein